MTFSARCRLHCIIGLSLLFFVSGLIADEAVPVGINGQLTGDARAGENSSKNQSDNTLNDSKMDAGGWLLYAEQWEISHHGESILSLPVLNTVISKWLLDKDQKIAIHYPGGEEGEFWVQQLSDWLVSLAIPSATLVLVPGSGADDIIRLDLIR